MKVVGADAFAFFETTVTWGFDQIIRNFRPEDSCTLLEQNHMKSCPRAGPFPTSKSN